MERETGKQHFLEKFGTLDGFVFNRAKKMNFALPCLHCLPSLLGLLGPLPGDEGFLS